MKIREIEKHKLTLNCTDLLSKTYWELGQRSNDEDIANLARSLATDLKIDFGDLEFQDIEQAFRQGIRNTDEFHLTVKVYYKWIKSHQQLIWNEENKNQFIDKRLSYRSRREMRLTSIQKKLLK